VSIVVGRRVKGSGRTAADVVGYPCVKIEIF